MDVSSSKQTGQRTTPPIWTAVTLGILGGVAGAIVGHFLFGWLLHQPIFNRILYAIMLPGVFTGLGCGLAARRRLVVLGVYSAVLAVVATVLTEWRFLPFAKDESLGFYLTHLIDLSAIKLGMMALGVAAAFWFGMGRDARS